MIIARHQLKYFRDMKAGTLFKIGQNDRSTFEVVNATEGTYRRSRSKESLMFTGDVYRVQVYECYRTENEPSERTVAAFNAMTEASEKLGWPEHFIDDMYFHDRITLYERNPEVFGWAVRNTGTEIMIPNHTHSVFLYTYYQRPEYDMERPRHRFFFWNGKELQPCNLERIETELLKASTEKTREFARQAWYTKNNSQQSCLWQQQIDREIQMKAHQREHIQAAY